jgi:hypothetical protein
LDFSELSREDPPASLLPFNMRSATGAHNQELVGAPDQGAGSSGPETESLATPVGVNPTQVFGECPWSRSLLLCFSFFFFCVVIALC